MWSERVSPLGWVGPARWFEPLVALDQLPHVDAVVISHDHFDHLDERTITAMKDWQTTFVVPPGIGAHLEFIRPMHGVVSKTRLYRAMYVVLGGLYPVLKRLAPKFVTTSEEVGRAMLRVAKQGADKKVLESADIVRLGQA